MKRTASILLALSLLVFGVGQLRAAPDADLDAALAWLRTQQQPDGGFTGGFEEGSDLGATTEILLAAVAAGEEPGRWSPSPRAYLAEQVNAGSVTGAAGYARLILGAVALGDDPRDFEGHDLVAALLEEADEEHGQFGDSLYAHAYALLALHNAGAELPEGAVALLVEAQLEDGSWSLLGEEDVPTGDSNTTALAVQALVAAGEEEPARAALPYFERIRNDDGGFPWQKPSEWGSESDANSTALVAQALRALGEDPGAWVTERGIGIFPFLQELQDAGSGAFEWQPGMGSNVLATAQAVQTLAGMTLVEIPTAPAVAPPETSLPLAGGPPLGTLLLLTGAASLAAGLLLRRAGDSSLARAERA
ncbi:MAG: prenyltransferase/squalene oxidase repeat-containing protein [Anaerolineales bacterium]